MQVVDYDAVMASMYHIVAIPLFFILVIGVREVLLRRGAYYLMRMSKPAELVGVSSFMLGSVSCSLGVTYAWSWFVVLSVATFMVCYRRRQWLHARS